MSLDDSLSYDDEEIDIGDEVNDGQPTFLLRRHGSPSGSADNPSQGSLDDEAFDSSLTDTSSVPVLITKNQRGSPAVVLTRDRYAPSLNDDEDGEFYQRILTPPAIDFKPTEKL